MNMVNEIIQLVKHYKDNVPKGNLLLNKRVIRSLDEMLSFLTELFTEEEKAIQEEHTKRFVADDYENGVRGFAVALMELLIPHHAELKQCRSYEELCRKKHVGYGYFHVVNRMDSQKTVADSGEQVIMEPRYKELLYLGLVEFYDNFYGKFADNEEAIELLCKYYPHNPVGEMEQHTGEVASALYDHISNAGTPNDWGYAYHGIELIEKFIGNLSPVVVEAVLREYPLYNLINEKVYRHQMFAIIQNADYKQGDKERMKFWYLDSLLIANLINIYLFEKMGLDKIEVEVHNNYYDYKLNDEKIPVFDEPSVYWMNDSVGERVLFLQEKPFISLRLQGKKIEIQKDGVNDKTVSLDYEYTDWNLDTYNDAVIKKKIYDLVLETRGSSEELSHNQMLLSLCYLNSYRGLHNQVIDFDHRYAYNIESKSVEKNTDMFHKIPHIYGKSVYSLSCIVGRNATGKTSIMDFLRETFFKLLRFIEEQRIACENGYVCETDYADYNILDRGAEFLMVFIIGNKAYFLTNMQGVKGNTAEPFHRGAYHSVDELSKVAYFSNQLRSDQAELLLDRQEELVYDEEKRKKQIVSKVNNGFRQVDYSEEESFIRRRKAIELAQNAGRWMEEKAEKNPQSFNKDICYQLSFLRKVGTDKICEYLEITKDRQFQLVSRMDREEKETFSLADMENNDKVMGSLERFVTLPDATIEHFSAGQYAKFTFLAKLYWFLEGDAGEIKRYNELAGNALLDSTEILLDGETALIFIDEGETYYHPEWQRGYIKTLLEMINSRQRKVQIIVTTNSPFLISDILSGDITYLMGEQIKEKTKEKEIERTLGQNIHKLLKDNFFMKYTIGEYSRDIIEKIMQCLQKGNWEKKEGKENDEQENREQEVDTKAILNTYFDDIPNYYEAFRLLIEQIGEPVYRYYLERLLTESPYAEQGVDEHIRELEEEKRKLQEKIDKLKEKNTN